MRDLLYLIEKYIDIINTDDFVRYKNTLAQNIQQGLSEGYKSGANEPCLVHKVVDRINDMRELKISNIGCISTKSMFIHGNKSIVEFDYYGDMARVELGDLVFILSIAHNGKKYFEKYTISQSKKDKKNQSNKDKKNQVWDLGNKEQLYLLSRFPSFRSTRNSLVPIGDYNLPNFSGCLGSYNFLFDPGDFIYVAAPILDSYLANKKLIRNDELYNISVKYNYYYGHNIYNPLHNLSCYFIYHYYPPIYSFIDYLSRGYIFGYSRYASNVYDFTDKYLRATIGELSYSFEGYYNKIALCFLNKMISSQLNKTTQGKNIRGFVNRFYEYDYATISHNKLNSNNNDGGEAKMSGDNENWGGFVFVHTIIYII